MISPLLITIFLLLALIHVYWAFGGKAGGSLAIPTKEGVPLIAPSRMATLLVASALALAALLIAVLSGKLPSPIPFQWVRWIGFGLSAIFLLRAIGEFNYVGFFKRRRQTPFGRMDTFLYSPLCLFISLGVLDLLLARRA